MALSEVKQEWVTPFMEGLTSPSEAWRAGFDIMTDDVASKKLASMSGISRVPVWNGSADRDVAEVNGLYDVPLTYTKYALQVRLNKYDVRDIPGLVADSARKLGVAIANTYGSIAADRMADIFAATTTAGDGVALVSDSHPNVNGGTRDNKLTSAFDRTSYMAAMSLARLWTDYQGNEDAWDGEDKVLFGSAADTTFYETAAEVFRSAVTSAANQANAAQDYIPQVVVWSKLTTSTRWSVHSTARKPLVFWIRAGAENETVIDEDNGNVKINTDFAIGTCAKPDPAGVVGSMTA